MEQKNTFFRDLVNRSLINEWAENIDWILNDNKFCKWEKKEKIKYTKLVKQYLKTSNIDYKLFTIDKLKNIHINKSLYVYMNSNSSESLELIRHIRNGIAHGHCNINKINNELCLLIFDFKSRDVISARLCIPIKVISDLRLLYKKVMKGR